MPVATNNVYVFPSFYSLVITGILVILIAILVIRNFKQILNLDFYKQISMMAIIAIAVGNHGLLHALFEPNKPTILLY
jgi:uncharacterized membrane protein HdeD (DUF308 family)